LDVKNGEIKVVLISFPIKEEKAKTEEDLDSFTRKFGATKTTTTAQ